MDSESVDSSNVAPGSASDIHPTPPANAVVSNASTDASSKQVSGISSWARNLKIPLPSSGGQDESTTGSSAKSPLAQFASGITSRLSSPREQTLEQGPDGASQSNFFGNITKGIVDSSKSAVRAVQVKARHVVSQNKRRYQEDGYDLDLTYITENIIAMGFPAGDMSSGLFGFVEGFYRNHMEEVISFLESHHKDKYKVYNLCSERLYDASLFEGKVACFPFDDHNCPPIHLIKSFCQSAYSWLKEDIENVVVVHCKAGMARTGLMISSLLLYLKFFPTAEESMDYYNKKRCFDCKGLVLPSQIRYVKYFERILTYFNGENQPGRRCMLRGFRLHRCPYWIRPHLTVSDHNDLYDLCGSLGKMNLPRPVKAGPAPSVVLGACSHIGVLFSTKKHPRTKDLSPEDFWFTAPKKGIMVFALPGEPGLTELAGDFKVQFHDRQGDFYFWLNTTMIDNRRILHTGDMDGFDKRKLPSPGFQVEIVLVDNDDTPSTPLSQPETTEQISEKKPDTTTPVNGVSSSENPNQESRVQPQDKDDVFSDDEGNEPSASARSKNVVKPTAPAASETADKKVDGLTGDIEKISLSQGGSVNISKSSTNVSGSGANLEAPSSGVSEFKAMAADASVFTFGDDEDYESE